MFCQVIILEPLFEYTLTTGKTNIQNLKCASIWKMGGNVEATIHILSDGDAN